MKGVSFLGTDKVPPTIFGIPVVTKDYLPKDTEFFKRYPSAGGYYDLGEEDGGTSGAVKGGDTKKFYGLRNDGKTWKGSGWLGELPLKGGGIATEYSVGVNIGGKDMDIPSLVPTLTRDEISQMTNDLIPNGKPLPESIVRKAAEHAKARIAEGKSVWANDGISIYEKAISDAVPFVKKHEGFSKTAYRKKLGTDKSGKPVWDKWTIGYGQTEIDGRPVRQGDVIDEKTASKFVEDRIRSQAADLYRDQKWSRNFRNPGTLSAMYDIMYNAGPAIFNEKNSPKLNEAMKTFRGDYDRYMWKEQIPTYRNKANGVEMRGLRNRNNDMTKAFGPRSSVV